MEIHNQKVKFALNFRPYAAEQVKGGIQLRHKDLSGQVHHTDGFAAVLEKIIALARAGSRIVERSYNPWKFLNIIDHFFLLPDVIAHGHDINGQVKQLPGVFFSNAVSAGSVLAIDNGKINLIFLDQAVQLFLEHGSPRPADHIANH